MVSPTTKTITIEALLVDEERELRSALEVLALKTSRPRLRHGALLSVAGITGGVEEFRSSRYADHQPHLHAGQPEPQRA